MPRSKFLEALKQKQYDQLERRFEGQPRTDKKDEEQRSIDRIFDEFMKWIEDTMTTEDNPYIKVVAVLREGG